MNWFPFHCPYLYISNLSLRTFGAVVSASYLFVYVKQLAEEEYKRNREDQEFQKAFPILFIEKLMKDGEAKEDKACDCCKEGEDGHQEGAIQAEIEDRTAREKRLADYEKLKEYQKGDPWKEEPLEDKRHKDADPKTDVDEEPKFSCKGEENCGWCKEQGLKGCLNPKAAEDGQSVVGASSCE